MLFSASAAADAADAFSFSNAFSSDDTRLSSSEF
jgi:hypothetical protein